MKKQLLVGLVFISLGDVQAKTAPIVLNRYKPLVNAIKKNNPKKVAQNIHKNNINNQLDSHGNTALHITINTVKNKKIALEKNKQGDNALENAAWFGFNKIVQILLNKGANIEVKDNGGHTPLILASTLKSDNADVAKTLLKYGAKVNIKDNNQLTALSTAAGYGNNNIVKVLIAHGANIETKDKYGNTPLNNAARKGYNDVVITLLAHGANTKAKDEYGNTALNTATINKHEDVVKTLLNYKL